MTVMMIKTMTIWQLALCANPVPGSIAYMSSAPVGGSCFVSIRQKKQNLQDVVLKLSLPPDDIRESLVCLF